MKRRWHVERCGDRLTLSRRPGRGMDVVAETVLTLPGEPKDGDRFRLRLAHLVRQDLWRALQAVRGLVPVVEVTQEAPQRIRVKAGATLLSAGAPETRIARQIEALLARPDLIRRWVGSGRYN